MKPSSNLLYALDDRPPWTRCLVYGFQWALVFLPIITIVSTILFPYLDLQANERVLFFQRLLIATGAITILQVLWGHRYPSLDGPAVAILLTCIVFAPQGLPVIQGGIIAGGIFFVLLSVLGLTKYLETLFTDNVIGVILILIAITLIPFLAPLVIGQQSAEPHGNPLVFGVSCVVILAISLFSHWLRGFPRTISLFLGIAVGTVLMWILGRVDGSGIGTARWLSFPTPFCPGLPQFSFSATIAFLVAFLAVLVNEVGSIYSIAEVVGKEGLQGRLKRGVAVTGVGGIISGAMGLIGTVTYTISPGVVLVTRVGSRHPVTVCGALLILLAFFQKFLAILASIPASVVGAVMVSVLSVQIGVGIAVLTRSGKPLSPRDYMVIGIPVVMGGIVSILPQTFFQALPSMFNALLNNGLVVGVVLVLLLEHVLLPGGKNHE
jgi:xanthine/uracil permease